MSLIRFRFLKYPEYSPYGVGTANSITPVDDMSLYHQLRRFNIIHKEQGQSLVEFALVLIFIIIPLIFSLIEASVLLYKYVALTNAAREGVRAGSVYLFVGDPGGSPAVPDAERNAAVLNSVRATLGPLMIAPSNCAAAGATSCRVTYGAAAAPIPDPLRSSALMTVTITHTHQVFFGALGSNINLRARASMRIEPSSVISGAGP